jgi:phosphoglycolate phosphatase
MTGPSLVIFDVDGTLVDSQHLILAAMAFAFGEAGHPVPAREEVLSVVGLSLPQAMAADFPDSARSPACRSLAVRHGATA